MAFRLQWSIEGEQQLLRNLRGVSETMGDWRPAFWKASKELKNVFSNEVFRSKGREIGESWAPLSPAYLAAKRKAGYPSQPLVRTGKMQKSFKDLVKADSATIWNAVNYFQYHQSNKPRSKLPRRVMMKLGNDQKEMVVKIFHTHFIKKLKQKL